MTEEYFHALEAPVKRLFILERSAHGALFEEPARFLEIMKEVLDETHGREGPGD